MFFNAERPLHARFVQVEAFGCFISMDGFRKNGLVHVSQLADYKVGSPHSHFFPMTPLSCGLERCQGGVDFGVHQRW
jgi:hypothetical protein